MLRTSTLFLVIAALLVAAGCGGGGSPATVSGGPVLMNLEPASGGMAGGTLIVLRGESLANDAAGPFEVLIGGQPAAKVTVLSDTEVECETPPGAVGAADAVLVNGKGESTLTGGFMYYPPPTVASITPESGTRDGDIPVTVRGAGFTTNDPGASVCIIGLKVLGSLVVVDDTTITGTTPSSWTEVPRDVIVRNRNGEGTLAHGYTYVGPIPQIDSVDPDFGQHVGGLLVTITGDYFTEAGGELSVGFGSATAASVTRIDDQTLTCVTPSSSVVGFVDVSVTNNNGTSVLPGGFYYLPPPVATSLTPTSGPFDGDTDVTITGEGFTLGGSVTVLFGSTLATSTVVVDDTTITCTTPAGTALGFVDVTVQNTNGTGTIEDGFEYLAPTFWWENTFGTAAGSTGDGYAISCPIPNSFPFFGTSWSSVYAVTDGHLDFGSNSTSYSQAHTLFSFPHISVFGCDGYTSAARNIYYTSHVSGRTIITYDNVPEYSSLGSNNIQVHLHQSGIFAIVYKGVTFHQGSYNPTGMVAVNPGGGTSVSVDWSSGPQSGGSGDALNEAVNGITDLSNCVLTFVPNSQGGYDSTYSSGVPTDPNP